MRRANVNASTDDDDPIVAEVRRVREEIARATQEVGEAGTAELEGYAAELAAEWVRDEQLKRMNEAEEIFERSAAESTEINGDGLLAAFERPEWSRANDLFHEAILDAAGNRRLKDTVRTLHRSFPRNVTWSTLSGNRRLLQENVEQHRAIAGAIATRDPAAARAAMTMHVRRSGELVALRYEQLQTAAS